MNKPPPGRAKAPANKRRERKKMTMAERLEIHREIEEANKARQKELPMNAQNIINVSCTITGLWFDMGGIVCIGGSWEEVESYCKSIGGTPVDVTNELENEDFYDFFCL